MEMKHENHTRTGKSIILVSVSFWPLLIIESVVLVSQHMLYSSTCSLSRYNVKGESDCFNCKTGFFLRLFTSMFTITIDVLRKKSTGLWGIFNNYKEKLKPGFHLDIFGLLLLFLVFRTNKKPQRVMRCSNGNIHKKPK